MKTEITDRLEKSIRSGTTKMGVYGCFEVTIGFCGSERVDYITYDTKGIFRCYEIKCSKADFYSKAKKTFVGHYNYYVLTQELYDLVKHDIPKEIGVYIGNCCEKKAKKQELSIGANILKDSMIRSLYRDSEKLYKTGDEYYIGRLKQEIERLKSNSSEERARFSKLYLNAVSKYGRDEVRNLMDNVEMCDEHAEKYIKEAESDE